jgi:gamma-glutamylcyclotransferase (GGCT)/AIG2-like uncharacterized protein YtfP
MTGSTKVSGCKFCGKAYINGDIYRVNDFYPGFIRGDNKVIGDVYLIDSSIFHQLDEFEGDEYNRTKIRTSTDIECWIYEYKYDVSKFKKIEGGDWMLR